MSFSQPNAALMDQSLQIHDPKLVEFGSSKPPTGVVRKTVKHPRATDVHHHANPLRHVGSLVLWSLGSPRVISSVSSSIAFSLRVLMARHASSVNTSGNDHNLPEVLIHAEREHLPLVPPLDGGEKERYLPDALQLVPPPINTHNLYTTQPGSGTPSGSTLWKKKRLWLPLATLVFLVAIVGGTVGGSLIHRDPPSRQASNEPPSSTAESVPPKASPALSSITAELVPPKASSVVSSTTTTTTLLQPSAKPLNSSLASVAWKDNQGLEYRRLYYQDSAGNIKESAWNNSANGWYSSSKALAQARQDSPLAAAVAGNLSWPFVGDWNPDDDRSSQLIGAPRQQLNLYYLDLDGRLAESHTTDGRSWKRGSLSFADIMPAPDSDLAATWTRHDGSACESCGEQTIVLAYEDSNNKLSVVNVTSSGPQWTTLDADPRPGSGLAVNLQWRNHVPPGIRLYYQRNEDDLVSIDWESQGRLRDTGNRYSGWNWHEDVRIGWAASGAPMASFSWGVDASFGDPNLMDILSSGPDGVRVNWWGGVSVQGWQEPENIDVMENVQGYTALAANTDRRVYALEAGVVQEFGVSPDGLRWSRIGVVPTEN